jgi:glycosyltransferase involved in cell wall biosynthesis
VALGRGKVSASDVTVVRTGPDSSSLVRREPVDAWRAGRRFLCAYLGVMGPQDGVDIALRAAARLVDAGRNDIQFVFIGSGDCFDELVSLASELGISEHVTFTGRAPDETVFEIFSTADLGLSPDPLNPLNDVSTMNKTMEYMAFGLPVVAFDLVETRVSAADAAVYVRPNDVDAYARAIGDLLDDPERRGSMARSGRERVEQVLSWEHQRDAYVEVYRRLVAARQPSGEAPSVSAA